MDETFSRWNEALREVFKALDEDRWDAAKEAALNLRAEVESSPEAAEFELLLEEESFFRSASRALAASRADAASSLLGLYPRHEREREATALSALATGDAERSVALYLAFPGAVNKEELTFRKALGKALIATLLGVADRTTRSMALVIFDKFAAEQTAGDTRVGAQAALADFAKAHDLDWRENAYGVNPADCAVVSMCKRRSSDPKDARDFEGCSARLGVRLLGSPAHFEESARCARACLARGTRNILIHQTAMMHCLLEGRDSDAQTLRETMAKVGTRATTVGDTWSRAVRDVVDLRRRRGLALKAGPDWPAEHRRLWDAPQEHGIE
jgi:hypothetical protein